MNWPSHTDYQDSIQNPHICFEEPTLKTAEVGCDMLGLPKVMSGNFACVYSVTTGSDRWAIRCFVRQVLGQQGRYARLSQHLFGLGLDCMVEFEYFLRGIKVRNEWYPIVKMRWVDGLPLNSYVDENFEDSALMRSLVPKWRTMVNSLRPHQLAHGDLQHGNIMVTPDAEFRLVDYDGMYTPAFRGKAPELGHANFQHPRRTPDYYNENLDDFSALVIHASFLAIADEPELFKKFYTGDNLIFLSADYRNPQNSEAFKRLKDHKNEQVKQLSTLLEKCCLADVSKVPNYEETIAALEKGSVDALMPSASAVDVSTVQSANAGWWQEGSDTTAAPATPHAPASAPRPAAPTARQPVARPAGRPAPSIAGVTPTARQPAAGGYRAPGAARPTQPSMRAAQTPRPTQQPAPVQFSPEPEDDRWFGLTPKQWLIAGGLAVVFFVVMMLLGRML